MLWLLRLIGMRRFFAGRLRTALTILGIAAGVSSLVATRAANEAILKGFHSTLDAISGDADISVTPALAGGLDDSVTDRIRDLPGVQSASPAITEVAKLPDGDQIYVFGVDMAAGDDTRGFNAFSESKPGSGDSESPDAMEFLNDPDGILISARFANAHGLKAGDRFPLVTPGGRRQFHVRGILAEKGAVKAFGGEVGVMDLYTAEAAFGRGKHVDRVDVRLARGAGVEQVTAAIRKIVGPGPTVGSPERKGESVVLLLRSFQVGLFMGSAVSLLVGLFLVFNTMSFAVTQRRREIGTLRALGTTRAAIAAMFAVEAAAYGAIGALLGLGIGRALAKLTIQQSLRSVNSTYLAVSTSDTSVSRGTMLLGLVMGVAGAVIAALVPAIEAATVPPVDALRRDRLSRTERAPTLPGRFLGLGVACLAFPLLKLPMLWGAPIFGNLAMGAIVLGAAIEAPTAIDIVHGLLAKPVAAVFGAPGRVAIAGLARARRRSGVAAGAVLIGIALVLCLDTFVGSFRSALLRWMEHAVPADLFVTQGANTIGLQNTAMPASVGDVISSVPGVKDVQPVRLVWIDYGNNHVGLYSVDWSRYALHSRPMFTDGDLASVTAGIKSGGIMPSDNLARRLNLHAGDHMTLATVDGPHDFTVAGAAVDYSSDRGTLMVDRATFISLFHDDKVDSFDTYLAPGADFAVVRRDIERRLAAYADIRVFSNAELRASVLEIVDDFFALVYALLFIAIAIGVLGVVGTLLAQVLDRTRELGIIRAMGASRGQVLAAVAIEAGLLALAGSLLGLPVGFAMGRIFVEIVGVQTTGWVFPPVYSWWFGIVAALVSIAFAGVGGLFPAQRAASLDVVEAIGYE